MKSNSNKLKFQIINCIVVVAVVLFSGCIAKNDVELKLKNPKKKSSLHETLNITVSNIQVVNNQVVITGTNLTAVNGFKIKEGLSSNTLQIESQTATTLIANTTSNVTFAAGKIFDFIFSSAQAASTFTVNFSLCDSLLGGKGFDCLITPTDKQVLSYDANSGKWKPRNVNGLNYLGAWDANDPFPSATEPGEYYIVSIANGIYSVGDWIVYNGTGFDKIDNSQSIVSVFGRTGAVTANLNDMTDVLISSPTTGQVLKYNGTKWVNGAGAETDPSVSAFAKTTLPTCIAGEVLMSDGLTFSCVTDNAGAGAFTGTQNRLVLTNGTTGALSTSTVTNIEAGYLSGVTSNIQTQINSKFNSSSFVDWSTTGVQTIDPTRINLSTANRVVVTNGSSNPIASTVTSTELGYLSGVTANIQTQLNAKLSSFSETDPSVSAFAKAALPTCNAGEVLKSNGTTFSCVTDNAGAGSYTGTQNRLVLTDGTTGALTTSSVSNVEAGYLSGVTSSIQTQLNAKQGTISKSTTQDISKLRIYGANTTNYVELSAATLTGNRNLIFPDSDGASGNVLTTDGAGNLSWTAPAAGGGTPSAGSVTDNEVSASANIAQSKISGLTTALSGKEPSLTAGSNTQYYRGDKTWQTLNTSVVPEVTNLYFTDARAKSAAVADSITDAIIDVAPSQNAVFDALGLKVNSASFIPWHTSGLQTIDPSRLNLGAPNASKALVTDASGFVTASSVTSTELGFVSGVTSSIQTQLNAKQSTIDKSTTQDVSKLRIYGANTSNYVELTAATLSGNRSLIFPDSDGTNGQVLSTNGSGVLTWISPAGSVTSVFGRSGAVVATAGDYTAAKITNTPSGNIAATEVQSALAELDTEKQNVSSFAADVRAVVITGVSTATNAVIAATDSILVAFGKLQAQISANTTSVSNKADQTNSSQTITAAAVTGLTTPIAGSDAVNKNYVDGFAQWTLNSGNAYRSSGNVGIGTNAPASPLEVAGIIHSTSGGIKFPDGSTQTTAASGAGIAGPSFNVHRNNVTQSVTTMTWQKILFTTEGFDTNNNFDTTSSRFTPTVAGKYLITGSGYCVSATTNCYVGIFKNGTIVTENGNAAGGGPVPLTSTIVDMNGTTDYVELYIYSSHATISGLPDATYFTGSLLAPLGNGSVAGTGTAGYLPIWTNSTTQSSSVIAQSGSNVGIGTNTPKSSLDVRGMIDASQISLNSYYNGSGWEQMNAGYGVLLQSDASFPLSIWYTPSSAAAGVTNPMPSRAMVINSSGNVGIATTNPTTALEVSGTVKATSFQSATGQTFKVLTGTATYAYAGCGAGNGCATSNVNFGYTFSSAPNVTISGATWGTFCNLTMLTVTSATTTGFTFGMSNPTAITQTATGCTINWQAIGN